MALQKKHWIWIGVGAAALTLTGIIIYQKRKKKRLEEEEKKKAELAKNFEESKGKEPATNTEPQSEQKDSQKPTSPFPLQKGSRNYEVKVLQAYMNSTCKASLTSEGVYPLAVDGIWGVKTEAGGLKCSSVKRNSIEPSFFNLMYRALDASKTLPQ